MTRPDPVPSGTPVLVDGWLPTRIVGHSWDSEAGEWSYRITADRARSKTRMLFHVRSGDFE